MIKYLKYLFLLVILFTSFFVFCNYVKAQEEVDLYLFYSYTCPHCHDERVYLETIKEEYGSQINIHEYEIIKDKETWIVVWFQIPEKKIITLTFNVVLERELNELATIYYLREGEKIIAPILFETKTINTIMPQKFKPLDTNKDNLISAGEINGAINGFFDDS